MSCLQSKGVERKSGIRHINTLLLKFPKIEKKLTEVRTAFVAADKDKRGRVTPEEFSTFCREEGVELDPALQLHIFDESDMNQDRTLDFQQFVVVCAWIYLLQGEMPPSMKAFAELYDMVIDAFMYFDKNNSGYLDRTEVMNGFDEGMTPQIRSAAGSSGFARQRFEELDWDHNGQVSFPEFLYAIEKWTATGEDEAPF